MSKFNRLTNLDNVSLWSESQTVSNGLKIKFEDIQKMSRQLQYNSTNQSYSDPLSEVEGRLIDLEEKVELLIKQLAPEINL